MSMRTIGGVAVVIMLASGCSGRSDDAVSATTDTASSDTAPTTTPDSIVEPTVGTASPTTTASAAEVELPDTPAGRQLRWVLEEAVDATDDEIAAHIAPAFLVQVTADGIRQGIADAGIGEVTEIASSTDTSLVVIATSDSGDLAVTIDVEADLPHLIVGLTAQPAELPEPPATWADVDSELTASGDASYLAAEVMADGSLAEAEASGFATATPLGSSFKLYVLGAVIQAIDRGELSWDDELTITDQLKSLPSGQLQDRPAGSTVTVEEAAGLMIGISDNTATDLLMDRVGRAAVEAMLPEMGMSDESQARTLPFMTTRELFTLKWSLPADELAAYAAANIDERRAVLDALDVPLPTVDQFDADTPVEIDRIEWFATGTEIAAAHLWLDKYRDRPGFEPLAAIVGDNPGVPLDPDVWIAVSFKGGSEPGVIFLGWLLQREDGRRFVVAVSVTNATGPVDEIRVASAGAGIIGLLGDLP